MSAADGRTWRGVGAGEVIAGVALLAVAATSSISYLLFHSLVELFSVVVAASVFLLAWNTRQMVADSYLPFLGIASLCAAVVDLLHLLAYDGMGVFSVTGPNLATQLWLVARGTQASCLVVAPLLIGRRVALAPLLVLLGGVTAALVSLVFAGRVPDAFLPDTGLTPFKIGSEYAIVAAIGLGGVLLWRRRHDLDPSVVRLLLAFLGTLAVSELAFTRYATVTESWNLFGHVLKVIAYFLLYRAIVRTGLQRPLDLLFRDLDLARAQLEQAVRLRDEVLSGVSHDLRSPLTTIRVQAQLLRRRATQSGLQDVVWLEEGVRRIEGASDQMVSMMDELVDTANLHIGEALVLRLEPMNLVELAERVVAEHSADAPRHQLQLLTPGSEIVGRWDAGRLRRVLDNLVGNAVKYSPDGGAVTVTVDRVVEAEGPSWAEVRVRDQGLGIPRAERQSIFERFRRGSNAKSLPGSGIGLAAAAQIVGQHGGRIGVESTEGRGSTFWVRLPLDT